MKKANVLYSAIVIAMLLQSCGDGSGNKPSGDTTQPKKDTTVTPVKPTDETGVFRGIDVSRYNGNLVSEIDAADSLTYIICKATEGIDFRDPDYNNNRKIIKDKGMISGNYHFYHTADDPIKQAEFFFNTMKGAGMTDMPPIVDIEQGSLPKGAKKTDKQKLQDDLLTFVKHLEKLSQRSVMIYTGESFANEFLTNPVFAGYALWLAEYSGKPQPVVPSVWKPSGYKIWQKTDNYDIDSKPTDYDVYNGPKSGLLK